MDDGEWGDWKMVEVLRDVKRANIIFHNSFEEGANRAVVPNLALSA